MGHGELKIRKAKKEDIEPIGYKNPNYTQYLSPTGMRLKIGDKGFLTHYNIGAKHRRATRKETNALYMVPVVGVDMDANVHIFENMYRAASYANLPQRAVYNSASIHKKTQRKHYWRQSIARMTFFYEDDLAYRDYVKFLKSQNHEQAKKRRGGEDDKDS